MALFFLGVIGAAAAFFIGYQTTKIPEPNKDFAANTTTVYYSDGKHVLGTFYEQNRRSVPLAQIPKTVQDAFIAPEDRTFWTNPGISPSGMLRAAYKIARGEQLQGGSTITQQYVKVMYLTQERTFSRKLSELFIATKLSRSQDKKSILEGYLNTVYFGRGAYGISAAGEAYFGVRDPRNLKIQQAAFLATVLNNPTRFNPDNPENKSRILDRYRYVLDGMRQIGTISDAQYKTYSAAVPKPNPASQGNKYQGTKGFLLDMARRELEKLVPADQVSGGGLSVTTTFDWGLQINAVRAAIGTHPKKTKDLHIGLASVKPGTGQLVAMYGGPDYLKSQLNWATLRARPGSSFKPFAVAAALKDGKKLNNVFQGDSPIVVQGQRLRNELNTDYGDVDLLKATEESVNTAFYDLVDNQMDNGPSKVVDAAEAAGIPKTAALERGRSNPATVLGPDPYASPVEMANAYATFAADGKYVPVHTIKLVKGPTGKTRWSDAAMQKGTPGIDPEIAKWVNYALQKVVENGTGTGAAELKRPVAGKTGTAGGVAVEHRGANSDCGSGCSDTLTSWWTGYTPAETGSGGGAAYSTSVLYRAGKTGEGDLDPYSSDPAFFGGNWPVKTWLAYMEPALKNAPEQPFLDPPDLSSYSPSPTYTPSDTPSYTPSDTPSGPPSDTPSGPPSDTPSTPPSNTPSTPPPDKPGRRPKSPNPIQLPGQPQGTPTP